MLVIVCYDVSTVSPEGRRRLRRVAKVCESMGQRVQNSVFECQVDMMRFEVLERQLLNEIDIKEDCLRFYKLNDSARMQVKEYGKFKAIDFNDPLII